MKKIILILILAITTKTKAQKDTIYYNSAWNKTTKKDAEFYRPMPLKKVGNLYHVKDYFINGKLQMEGFWSHPENETFEGEARWYYKNGQLLQQLNYKNDVLEGLSTFYTEKGFLRAKGIYKNGDYYTGTFQSFCCPGRVTQYQEGKEIAYLTFYKNLKQLAKKEIFIDGNISKIQYFDKKGAPLGEINYKDDEAISGTYIWFYMDDFEAIAIQTSIDYKNGKRNGKLISFDEKGKQIAKGIYKDDIPYSGTFYDADKYTLSSYKEGKKQGLFIQYNSEGKKIAQQEYNNDKKTGATKSNGYFKNRTCTCTYKDGEPFTGEVCKDLSVLTYENGRIIQKTSYKRDNQGTVEEVEFYNAQGEIITKNTYYHNKKLVLTFKNSKPANGQIYSRYNHGLLTYKDGRLNGPFTEYTYNKVLIKGNYNDEAWDGRLTFDDKQNAVKTACTYKDGKPIDGTTIENNCITTYKNGLKSGLEKCKDKLYFKINNKYTIMYDSITTTYKNGKIDGEVRYFKKGKWVSSAYYYEGHIHQGTVYVKKTFENYYKNNKLVKSTYYFGKYKLEEDYNDYLITKETTYKDHKIEYQGYFKNGEAYNGTFITIKDKEEPREYTRTYYKKGKKYGKEQTINLIDDKIVETTIYKKGIRIKTIKKFPLKDTDSIVGIYKNGNPFSGYFYTQEHTIEKIEHYQKSIKTGMQYYYSATGSLLKKVLDSIKYVNGKPIEGVDLEVVNNDYYKNFYKNGKRSKIAIYDTYYQGITKPPFFKVLPTDTGFITFISKEKKFDKYNEIIYTNTNKTEGKVTFYGEKEKGYLQFKDSKLIDVQIKLKIPYISFTMYLEKPNVFLVEGKSENFRIKMYPQFELPATPNYNDFLNINQLFFRGSGIAYFYVDNQLLSTCSIKKGKGFEGTVIKQQKNGMFMYRKHLDGSPVETRKNLTKEKLITLLKKQ